MSGQIVGGVLAVAISIFMSAGLHAVPEGHVGVYWRGGALLSTKTQPGFHIKLPLITSVHYVQVTMQSDQVLNIPCGTRGGVMIYFEKVEVVNKLKDEYVMDTIRNYTVNYDTLWIFDRVHHEINELCSAKTVEQVYITEFMQLDELLMQALTTDIKRHAPGIDIVSVRVTKPRIPESIRKNYEEMEASRTQLMIAIEEQKVVQLKAETDKMKAMIEAQKAADVSEIEMSMKKVQQLSSQKIASIQDEIHMIKEKGQTDAMSYREQLAAKANKLKFTPEYLKVEAAQAISDRPKTYFSSKGSDFMQFWDSAFSTS